MKLNCKHCKKELEFDQPYPIHAGFSDEGFLYDDAGNLTLVWSSYDPIYQEIVGSKQPWDLNKGEQEKFESTLWPSPSGGKWSFKNSLRCRFCHEPVSGPITETIYYYRYSRNLDTSSESSHITLSQIVNRAGLTSLRGRRPTAR